jgi:hypothetical protein
MDNPIEIKRRSFLKEFAFQVFLFAFFFCLIYFGVVVFRTAKLYTHVKTDPHAWLGELYRADSELGIAPIPNTKGFMVFPDGEKIPVVLDADGFRISSETRDLPALPSKPVVLALGDSFTFGAYVPSEKTFTYQAARKLNGVALNAGVCGVNLAHMLIVAERYIPRYKPDYVIVQFSPWLARRSLLPLAPYRGALPVPFFVKSNTGTFEIHKPVFKSKIFNISTDLYRHSPSGIADFLSFFARIGWPLYLYDDLNIALFQIKKAVGIVPHPIENQETIIKFTYRKIAKLCRENNSRMIIVLIGGISVAKPNEYARYKIPDSVLPGSKAIRNIEGAAISDANIALLNNLPKKDYRNYAKTYCHWWKNQQRLFDCHPNASANEIIASEILKTIKRIK